MSEGQIFFAVLVILFAFLFSRQSPPPADSSWTPSPVPTHQIKVRIFGDSHMQAMGPQIVARLLTYGISCDYLASPGWSLKDYANAGNTRDTDSDLVVFELGTNDASKGLTSLEISADMMLLVSRVDSLTRTMFVGPPMLDREDLRESGPRVDAIMEIEAASLRSSYFKSSDVVTGGWQDDGVHFDGPTYKTWANAIADRIASIFNK